MPTVADDVKACDDCGTPLLRSEIERSETRCGDCTTMRAVRAGAKIPAIYPCGCSRNKVALGMCDTYNPGDVP